MHWPPLYRNTFLPSAFWATGMHGSCRTYIGLETFTDNCGPCQALLFKLYRDGHRRFLSM